LNAAGRFMEFTTERRVFIASVGIFPAKDEYECVLVCARLEARGSNYVIPWQTAVLPTASFKPPQFSICIRFWPCAIFDFLFYAGVAHLV
jgi:hypothetical protein